MIENQYEEECCYHLISTVIIIDMSHHRLPTTFYWWAINGSEASHIFPDYHHLHDRLYSSFFVDNCMLVLSIIVRIHMNYDLSKLWYQSKPCHLVSHYWLQLKGWGPSGERKEIREHSKEEFGEITDQETYQAASPLHVSEIVFKMISHMRWSRNWKNMETFQIYRCNTTKRIKL